MFVPGNKERFLSKARGSSADCVLLDLEDGVLPESKGDARSMVASVLGQPFDPQCYVRLNAISTGWHVADLEAVVVPGLEGVCLSKCESPEDVETLAGLLDRLEPARGVPRGSVRIVAAIESATSLIAAPAIARAHPRVVGLILGAEDFALDLGLGTHREAEASELVYARSAIVVAAAAARVLSIDGVHPDLDDEEGMLADTLRARRLGFSAKSTFNPRQLEVINKIFSPLPDEIAYARRVVEAFEEAERRGDASVAVGGQLVDRPIVMRARRLLETLESLGQHAPEAS